MVVEECPAAEDTAEVVLRMYERAATACVIASSSQALVAAEALALSATGERPGAVVPAAVRPVNTVAKAPQAPVAEAAEVAKQRVDREALEAPVARPVVREHWAQAVQAV